MSCEYFPGQSVGSAGLTDVVVAFESVAGPSRLCRRLPKQGHTNLSQICHFARAGTANIDDDGDGHDPQNSSPNLHDSPPHDCSLSSPLSPAHQQAMRESNFAFPAQNRACVCITSQLYDRRGAFLFSFVARPRLNTLPRCSAGYQCLSAAFQFLDTSYVPHLHLPPHP